MANLDRIRIVGGGIGGLSLAVALNRQGYSSELIEGDSEWPSDGTAIMTPANGVRVLHELGVDNDLEKHATTIRRWGFYDRRGEQLCETNLESLWKDVGPCLGISRKRLLESLLKAAKAVPRRLGVSITWLKQDCNLVHVKFTHGNSDDYDLVIGADGIYSTVRRLVMNSSQPCYAGNIGWRSIVSTRLPNVVDNIMFFLGEGCIFGLKTNAPTVLLASGKVALKFQRRVDWTISDDVLLNSAVK